MLSFLALWIWRYSIVQAGPSQGRTQRGRKSVTGSQEKRHMMRNLVADE
jgi:hypothetical protein